MPFPRYNPFYIKGILKPILLNFFKALLYLFSFRNFFSFFNNITIPNTPFAYFIIFNLILMPTTLNYYIY